MQLLFRYLHLKGVTLLLTLCFGLFGGIARADDESDKQGPQTTISIVPQIAYSTSGNSGESISIGLLPLQVEKPFTSNWALRVQPEFIARTGTGIPWEMAEVGIVMVAPRYFTPRGDVWSVRGGYLGPAVAYRYYPQDSSDALFYGVETGYGWQSGSGFFLILMVQFGTIHRFDNPTNAPQDGVNVQGGITLGYQVN